VPATHCHCKTCQKTQAAVWSTSIRVSPDALRFTAGEDKLTDYWSSPDKRRRFCSVCGCHIVAIKDGQDSWILRAATLDEDPQLRPGLHIWCDHDRAWMQVDGQDMVRHPQWPAPG
jgi:ADP-ribosyl-[dinitrogen reductase] hydrolase